MQRLDYDSFGRVLRDTNPGFQPFGFQGGLYDPDTGLVEFGCRWYDAETGRWISKDPILLDGGWNVYAFCDNDPVNRTDPSGLCEDVGRSFGDKFFDGYYVGTGFGESALNYYCSILDNPDSTFLDKTGAYIGGFFSALWTRETYVTTALTLSSAYMLRNVAHTTHIDIKLGAKPKVQIRYGDPSKPVFRVEKAPFGKGASRNQPRWHYHRKSPEDPGMKWHRPYQGGW